MPDPSEWCKPYFANSAWAIRGWRDLARIWPLLVRWMLVSEDNGMLCLGRALPR